MPAKFSYKNDSDTNRLNPYDLRRAEAERAKLRDIENNYHKDADPSTENDNIERARNLEQSGIKTNLDSIKQKAADMAIATAGGAPGKVFVNIRKNLPAGTAVVVAGGFLAFLMFSPLANPLLSFAQNSSEARANASRSQAAIFGKKMEYVVNNDKVAAACAKNVSSAGCKRGTLSERQKKLYESGKFKIDGENVGGRYLVKSITAPDGFKIDSGAKFATRMSTDLNFARQVIAVHNVRALVFTGGQMLKRVLLPFGLNKTPLKDKIPTDKEERKKFLSRLFGLGDNGTVDEEKAKEKIKIKAGELGKGLKIGSKATGAAAVVGATCTLYNTARVTLDTAKAQRFIVAMSIVMPFLKVASQIRDNGTVETDTVSALGDQITARDKDGLSALDAPEVKEVFGTVTTGVSTSLQSYLLFNNPVLKNADNIIKTIDSGISSAPGLGGAKTARAICREVNSWKTTAIQLTICGIGTAAGSAVPIAGNVAGFISACAAPMLAGFAIGLAAQQIASKLFDDVVIPWVTQAAIAGLPAADAIGPQLGTVLGLGAAVMMNNTNRINGLVPMKKSALTAYNQATSESDELYKQVQIADAQDHPLDANNQYSLLGSISSVVSNTVVPAESRIANGTIAFQRLFSSWSLLPTAMAIGDSQSVITANNLRPCLDPNVTAMGYQCDSSDQVVYGNSPEALQIHVDDNLNYLHKAGYLDEADNPKPGSDLEKFVKYCGDNNEIGMSAESIESDDYDWSTKEKCGEDSSSELMSQFQAYVLYGTGTEDGDMTEAEGDNGLGIDVMSYNILGTRASIINDNSGGVPWRERLNNAVLAVKEANPDVVGFQEVTGAGSVSQFDLLKKNLSDTYTGFPSKETAASTRVIYWRSDKFTLVDSGTYEYSRNDNPHAEFPWVKLQETSTGKEFYVYNTHTSAGGAGDTQYGSRQSPPKARRDQTRKLVAAIQKEVPPGSPVLVTGDFNATCEKTGNDKGVTLAEIPCSIMRAAGFENAGEIAHSQGVATNYEYATSHGAPKSFNKNGRHIDHVFYTSDFRVISWENIINSNTEKASDHTPVMAKVTISVPEQNTATGNCPTGTTLVNSITEGYERSGSKKQITLCAIPGTRVIDSSATPHWKDARYKGTTAAGIKQIAVNANVAADALNMAQAAKSQGITLTATISYRSLYEQCSIVIKRYKRPSVCPSWITPVTGNWSSNATYSNHMMGYSIDFSGSSISWMKRNGQQYGFIDDVYRAEGWDQAHFTNKPSKPANAN